MAIQTKLKVLLIDIETSPHEVFTWDVTNVNYIGPHMMKTPRKILCFAAQWLHKPDEIIFHERTGTGVKMLKAVRKLLNEADMVVHFNGKKFDVPTINKELFEYGIAPPSSFMHIDIYVAARRAFNLPYKSLEYICNVLKIPGKSKHGGIQLWIDWLKGKPEAKAMMKKYNMNDVVITRKVFEKVLPWLPTTTGYKRIMEYYTGKRKMPK
jgi:DNA polymerase elongation subunit (family B)